MKQFIKTDNNTFTFSTCENCKAKCCSGNNGTIFAQILLSDFKETYKNFPILFIFGELGYIKPVVLLTNGKDFCQYLRDYKCSIYENRPSICRAYPLSSNIDDLTYIDHLCEAVNDNTKPNKTIIQNNQIQKDFDYPTLHNYQDKYINTFRELEVFNKKEDFCVATIINGLVFYRFNKIVDNIYMQMHQESLVHLTKKYFIN